MMYCNNCGAQLSDEAFFCGSCGAETPVHPEFGAEVSRGPIGYSSRINDPAFAKYLKNTNRWAVLFSLILAIAALLGFYIYGETSSEMDNPQALIIGSAIAALFLLIALFQVLGRKRSKTWDGVVVDKTVKEKKRRQSTGNDDYTIDYYTEYAVIVKEDGKNKKHRIVSEDDATLSRYFQIGDRVRHHAGLNSYEKYDKSADTVIFCNACATRCDINDEYCFRCKCPLLK